MSAFAAFRQKSVSELFGNDEDDDEIIKYEIGSSDEDIGEKPTNDLNSNTIESKTPTVTPSAARIAIIPEVSESKFIPNDDNFLVFEDHVIVGLKTNEFLLVAGQCKVTIQRGAVLLNEMDYHHADPNNPITIVSTSSQSLPMISSTQITNREGVKDTQNDQNKHLFSSDYKSVLMIANHSTGVEDIGKYWRPFKRFFGNKGDPDSELLGEYEKVFQTYTFEIVLRHNGSLGLNLDTLWGDKVRNLSNDIAQDLTSTVSMIIGNKNSGKTTLSKTLTNALLLLQNLPIAYLDLDPGQSEFSAPYTLSLSLVSRPIYGMNLFDPDQVVCSHYYGFTTPQQHPDLYLAIAKSLLHTFVTNLESQGIHLIINTPGWIKGFGMEILNEITKEHVPDHLIFLSGNLDATSPENIEVLSTIGHKSAHVLQGIYQNSKYSPSQLRTWNKLLYFHRQTDGDKPLFNFESHILNKAPLQLPFQTDTDCSFTGVNAVLFLNISMSEIDSDSLPLLLEACIVGFYLIEYEHFLTYNHCELVSPEKPIIINQDGYLELLDLRSSDVIFAGLGMVHSINLEAGCFNVYLPPSVENTLTTRLGKGMKLVMIKGEGDVPSAEFLNPEFLKAMSKKKKETVPYISLESNKVAGVWKMRRNVMRRGQR